VRLHLLVCAPPSQLIRRRRRVADSGLRRRGLPGNPSCETGLRTAHRAEPVPAPPQGRPRDETALSRLRPAGDEDRDSMRRSYRLIVERLRLGGVFIEGGIVFWKRNMSLEHVIPVKLRQEAHLNPSPKPAFLCGIERQGQRHLPAVNELGHDGLADSCGQRARRVAVVATLDRCLASCGEYCGRRQAPVSALPRRSSSSASRRRRPTQRRWNSARAASSSG
jgi:hypothetical protein